ncbi:hypothetical protein K8F61_09465 [Microbacterium resistens]|uniref:Uncharacterized protein n=1 Tax=Microbacterium resistens TaxID=156977 RepID=A0ABY3RWV4_9MICO|nr:hypothetical protein [Microbacterium resistens]UGS28356.1 hypothetical protein K8F61_09465 [Microbacterium resistens]
MNDRTLSPDTRLGIKVSAIMSRNKYTDDPGPVIDELYQVAGDRPDILADEIGLWVGFYEDEDTRTLAAALCALPLDLADGIALGQQRRNEEYLGTASFTRREDVPDQP